MAFLIRTTPVYELFWLFAAKRQSIFSARTLGRVPDVTADPIIGRYRFTNAYRASDRVSQYLIRNVIYVGDQRPNEIAFRVLLFKTFNKIETWERLRSNLGEICTSSFRTDEYDAVLRAAQVCGNTIYSGAYILPSGKNSFGSTRKHVNHLILLKRLTADAVGDRITETRSLEQLYNLLLSYPTIGRFLAFQYAIDINYSELTSFSEMDFVVAGPGARSGVEKCFYMTSDQKHEDIIRYVTENQEKEFERRELEFKTLWGRPLQLIDVQNLFCEIDKYSRVAMPEFKTGTGRHRIKRLYTPNPAPIEYWFPPKWGINEKIANSSLRLARETSCLATLNTTPRPQQASLFS